MSTSAPSKLVSGAPRVLPLLIYFEADQEISKLLRPIQRFRRINFTNSQAVAPEVERIYVVGHEELVRLRYEEFRHPNSRVIAISSARFREPRLDGAIYAYFPPNTAPELLERAIDNALDHIHFLQTRHAANQKLRGISDQMGELNAIGAALSAQRDTPKLLELILSKCREITNSDAGSLYLVEAAGSAATPDQQSLQTNSGNQPERKQLRFKLAQNDSVKIAFREVAMEISEGSIAGHVASTGEILNIEDAYHLPEGVPYQINPKFDEDSGYRTKSILAIPMRNQRDEIVGVLQLINAKRNSEAQLTSVAEVEEQVVSYQSQQQAIVESLASQAAIALENSQLNEAIQRLFEGFVRASVHAIEARDPATSGHSFRVANLTVAFAEAVDRVDNGPYRDLSFNHSAIKEIRYASLLHDFGKVGVREEVLVKAKKLYPLQLDLVHERFQFVKRSMEVACLQSKLQYLLEQGRDSYLARLRHFNSDLAAQLKEMDDFFQVVLSSDIPTVLPEGDFQRLLEIASRRYSDYDGSEKPLLTPDEVRLLSIRQGSLDDDERLQIESHVVHTFNFLQQIPWTSEIKNVPQIARGHHEKLNGQGYPYKLTAPEIPVQTRMMTITDIFDALSAADRPYKKAVSQERALEILEASVQDGELDADLYKIFLQARIYEKWKVEAQAYS